MHVDREFPIVLDALWIQSSNTDNSKSSASSHFETKGKMQKAQQIVKRMQWTWTSYVAEFQFRYATYLLMILFW